jgi:sugar-specific transcriptional regulator TrmB
MEYQKRLNGSRVLPNKDNLLLGVKAMLSTKNLILPLLEIGLNKYEAKVYLTLVAEGTSTAKNVSDITGIPYGKVYEIINSLSNKGFCILLPSKPMKCQAVSPRDAIVASKRKVEEQYKRLETQVIKQLEPMFAESKQFKEPKSLFWVINGRANIVQKLEELFSTAKKQINVYTSANGLSRLLLQKDLLKELHSKGVEINIAAVTNKEVLEEVKSMNFCNIRHISEAQNHLYSIDGNHCLIVEPIPDDDNIVYGRDLGMWMQSPSFTKFIERLFNTDFSRAKKINFESIKSMETQKTSN